MKALLIFSWVLFAFTGCKSEKPINKQNQYLRWVGDSEYDSQLDDPDFSICRTEEEVFQYFNLMEGPQYHGEKTALIKHFKTHYKPVKNNTQSGYIRVRFVVNCKGEAGRFRVIQSDTAFKETQFDKEIVNQLVTLTKEVEQWTIQYKNDAAVDYYQYLVFKINNGQIIEILP
ncbi:MAG: hypothetical protein ACPGRC_11430 [Salibacteraceae bacterium]